MTHTVSLRAQPSALASIATAIAITFACSAERARDQRPPHLESAEQNRTLDPSGATLDLSFDEPLRASSAEDPARYVASNGAPAMWAVLLSDDSTVRVTFAAALIPGETTLAADGILDRAGNESAPVEFFPIGSDDTQAPALVAATATTVPGSCNDRVEIAFDDDLVAADVLDASHLAFEHPIGTARALDGATVTYDEATRTLALCFDATGSAAIDLHTGAAWRLAIDGVRDLGGNALPIGSAAEGLVGGDATPPSLVAATQSLGADATGRVIDLAFSEPLHAAAVEQSGAYAGSGGQGVVDASLLWPADVVRVTFDAPLVPGVDSIEVQDVLDLAGNQIAAVPSAPIAPADTDPPEVAAVVASAVSGFANDTLVVVFDEPVLPADAVDPSHFELSTGIGLAHPLAGSDFTYDAAARRTTITLRDLDLVTGSVFALRCSDVRDVSGNPLPSGSGVVSLVGGDASAPTAFAAQQNTVIDPLGKTLDVLFDEPVLVSGATLFWLDGGIAPLSVQTLGGGTAARLLFAIPTLPGIVTLDVVGLSDPAGNVAGTLTLAVVGVDATPPLLIGSTANALEGAANDRVTATFDEQVLEPDAVASDRWSLESPPGTSVPIGAASFAYDPLTRSVTIVLPQGSDLATGATYALTANGIHDVGGNLLAPGASSNGVVGGDVAPPAIVVADRNQVADPSSRIVDVTFSEAVSAATAQVAINYNVSGTPNTQSATLLLDGRTVRLHTTAAVTPGTTTIAISGVRDLASNTMAAAPIVAITP